MDDPEKQKPAGIILPRTEYKRAIRHFKKNGKSFDDAIEDNPREAYELFGRCVALALMDGRVNIVSNRLGDSVDKNLDGEDAFKAIGERVLNLMPPLGDDEREVEITVTKVPLLSVLRQVYAEPITVKTIRFNVPAVE